MDVLHNREPDRELLLERHRVVASVLSIAMLVLVGCLVGEVVGTVLVVLVRAGLGVVGGS